MDEKKIKMLLAVAFALEIITVGSNTNARVDLSASKSVPFAHYWKKCVGSGHMLLGTRADWQAHLKLAHDELGFQGIRGHGLLDDDMSTAPRIKVNGTYVNSFYNTDVVFDYLVELGMKPVVELSFTPSRMIACGRPNQPECSYVFGDSGGYKGLRAPPDDFTDWYDLVHALGTHLVARYGLDEVSSWHFEVWNELWGVPWPHPYIELYNASARAIKAVHTSLKVGGPATMQMLWVPDFIAACKGNATSPPMPVDFVSSHLYPTDPECQTDAATKDPDCFAHLILAAQKQAEDAGLPFLVTEYNDGLGRTSRDDTTASSFVFRNIGLLGKVDMLSWWTFTDIFEEDWMQSEPFHNGYGMMTMRGVRKPVWRAFELLAKAGDRRLAVTGDVSPLNGTSDISVLATMDSAVPPGVGGLGVKLYIANYHRLTKTDIYKCNRTAGKCFEDVKGTYTDEALCNANCNSDDTTYNFATTTTSSSSSSSAPLPPAADAPVAETVTVTLVHGASQTLPSTVAVWRIDEDATNPQKAWIAMGSPTYPSPAQQKVMHAASALLPPTHVKLVAVSSTTSTLTLDVPAYGSVYVEL